MKKTALDKAIEALEKERAVLDLAIAKLKAQQTARKAPARKPSILANAG